MKQTKRAGFYKRTRGGSIVSLHEAVDNFEDLDLEFEEPMQEESVPITMAAITQLCKVFAPGAEDEETAAYSQALFALGQEQGVITGDTVSSTDSYNTDEVNEDGEAAFSSMANQLKDRGTGVGNEEPGRRGGFRSRENGVSSSGRFRVKDYSTGKNYSRILPDEDDYDETATKNADDVRRGRGRPAGASNKDTSYKPWSPEAKAAFKAKLAANKAARQAGGSVNETEEDQRAIDALRAKFQAKRASRQVNETEEDQEAIAALRAKFKALRAARGGQSAASQVSEEKGDRLSSIRAKIKAKLNLKENDYQDDEDLNESVADKAMVQSLVGMLDNVPTLFYGS